ncbi:MAG: hypothetical protein EOP84_24130 [Verrucomicrobiaceae bacterium]|nr:MAG: hypothetical protein EOP84_24130 [Verrucomicrobiaceae bacterium]
MNTTALRTIAVSLPDLYTNNFFGMDETEADANQPLWVAQMENLAARDGVTLVLSSRQQSEQFAIEGYDADEEDGDIYGTAEYSWYSKASDEAWATVNA